MAVLRVYQARAPSAWSTTHLSRRRCGLRSLVRAARSAPEQRPSRDGNAQPDEDGEPEHGVGCAYALVECDASPDHGDREPYVERDEQIRCHGEAVCGRARLEHDPGGPLEHRTGPSADQRTADQEERQVRDRKAHGDNEKDEPSEHGERADCEHAGRPQLGRYQLGHHSAGEHQAQSGAGQCVGRAVKRGGQE